MISPAFTDASTAAGFAFRWQMISGSAYAAGLMNMFLEKGQFWKIALVTRVPKGLTGDHLELTSRPLPGQGSPIDNLGYILRSCHPSVNPSKSKTPMLGAG